MSAGDPNGTADSPVYCPNPDCNHDGRATCPGCGGRNGSYGKKPCKYCLEIPITTTPPDPAPIPPSPSPPPP